MLLVARGLAATFAPGASSALTVMGRSGGPPARHPN